MRAKQQGAGLGNAGHGGGGNSDCGGGGCGSSGGSSSRGSGGGSGGGRALFSELLECRTLTVLDLSANDLRDDGAGLVLEALLSVLKPVAVATAATAAATALAAGETAGRGAGEEAGAEAAHVPVPESACRHRPWPRPADSTSALLSVALRRNKITDHSLSAMLHLLRLRNTSDSANANASGSDPNNSRGGDEAPEQVRSRSQSRAPVPESPDGPPPLGLIIDLRLDLKLNKLSEAAARQLHGLNASA